MYIYTHIQSYMYTGYLLKKSTLGINYKYPALWNSSLIHIASEGGMCVCMDECLCVCVCQHIDERLVCMCVSVCG